MTKTNDVVNALLASLPVSELGSDDQRRILGKIKSRFAQTADAEAELKSLYKVKGLSDFATVMMWLLDRSQKDPQRAPMSPEDETLLLSTFRRALGNEGLQSEPSASPESGEVDEKGFASRLDRFSEAVQSGIEGRGAQLENLFNDCGEIAIRSSEAEFKEFAALMGDFLKFIAEGELLDDVRVINMVSNIASSISQWVISPPEDRHALMEDSLSVLRDFRTHFE